MLSRMFENFENSKDQSKSSLMPSVKDENGCFLIDRSPKYFEPILNYLRTGRLVKATNNFLIHLGYIYTNHISAFKIVDNWPDHKPRRRIRGSEILWNFKFTWNSSRPTWRKYNRSYEKRSHKGNCFNRIQGRAQISRSWSSRSRSFSMYNSIVR